MQNIIITITILEPYWLQNQFHVALQNFDMQSAATETLSFMTYKLVVDVSKSKITKNMNTAWRSLFITCPIYNFLNVRSRIIGPF